MDFQFLPNYFAIGSLNAFLFFLFLIIVFIRVKEPSHSTLHLIGMAFSMLLFNFSYIISHGFSNYPTFWTRFINIFMALVGNIHATAFFFYFPDKIYPKIARLVILTMYTITIIVGIWIIFVFWNAPYYYIFNSHFWDSDTLYEQKIASLIILVFFIFTIIVGIWRSIIQKDSTRKTVIALLVAMAIVLIIPGVLHVLSRDGLAERSDYMTSFVLTNIIGFFLIAVIYINKTKDKTTILARLVGITLATILLILQITGYFYLKTIEDSFDKEHLAFAKEFYILGKDHPHQNFQLVFNRETEKLASTKGSLEKPILEERERLLRNSSYLLEISQLPKKDFPNQLKKFLLSTHPYFKGYAGWLRTILENGKIQSPEELVQIILSKKNRIRYINSKIRPIPQEKWDKESISILNGVQSHFPGFLEALGYPEKSLSKKELQTYLTPIPLLEQRNYAGRIEYKPGEEKPIFSVAYSFYVPEKNVIVETGFSYLEYRKAIASSSWILITIILASYFLILFGFRFFYGGALLDPIERLVEGLREVNSGNLNARVEVQVEDEIGFMTKSFNNMTLSIKVSQEKLKDYAEHLEDMVRERTRELSETLKTVQELKTQQDGDYFLTKLLLEPLGKSQVQSPYIHLESFVKQKKQFTFRKWENDIGGDMNIAYQVTLSGKKHIAFVNADAMGKSMQGAGGALVLGSVFHTILDRTEMNPTVQMLSPERWLKNLFIELHKVFESFNGSMLVSGFFGLLDEESGFLYYLNCEHPKGVLYRDGKASFFEKDVVLRKLGTSNAEGTLKIETFQMEPGDVIILGSDGRDDILLGTNEEGVRIINENENLFLKVVEEAKGEIHAIVDKLKSLGELTDDLSLLRIERLTHKVQILDEGPLRKLFKEVNRLIETNQQEEAVKLLENFSHENPINPEVTKALAKLHYQLKNYELAARYANEYLFLKPSDHEFLYFASLCFRRIRNFPKSVDLSERLRLRNLNFTKNLALLADLHLRMKNLNRAKDIFEELKELDPDSQVLQYIQERLEKFENPDSEVVGNQVSS